MLSQDQPEHRRWKPCCAEEVNPNSSYLVIGENMLFRANLKYILSVCLNSSLSKLFLTSWYSIVCVTTNSVIEFRCAARALPLTAARHNIGTHR